MQQLASLPGAGQEPASTLSKVHPLPRRLSGLFSPMKLGDCLLLRKKVATRARLVGSLFPRTKGAFQSICMSQTLAAQKRSCRAAQHSPQLQHTQHTIRPEPPAGLHAECERCLAQNVQLNACTVRLVQSELYSKRLAMLSARQCQETWTSDAGHAHTSAEGAESLQSQLCSNLGMVRLGTVLALRVLQGCSSSQ